MAVEKTGETLPGIEAAADLSTNQFHAVRIDSNGQAALATAGQSIAGVLQNKPNAAGVAATIWGPGTLTKMVAGATVAAGADVTPDGTGRAVTAATTNYIIGQATIGGAVGELISVFITQPGRLA